MQDKDLYNDKEKKGTENIQDTPATEDTVSGDVVYVVNDDGTSFDTSERTYVAVEGLEEELERREEAKEEADEKENE